MSPQMLMGAGRQQEALSKSKRIVGNNPTVQASSRINVLRGPGIAYLFDMIN